MAEWMKTLLQGLVAVTPWATALTLALLLARRLAKGRVPARAWRAVWLVLALRLALPVDVSLPKAPVQMELPPALVQHQEAAPRRQGTAMHGQEEGIAAVPAGVGPAQEGTATPAPVPREQEPAARPAAQVDWAALLAFVWAAGAAVYLLAQLGVYAAFLAGLRRSRRPLRDEAALAAAREAFGGPLPVYESDRAASPMLVGLLRPALYLPEGLPRAALRYILPHEARHKRAWDVPYQFLLTLAQAVQWYNPAAHLLAHRARADMELACDEAVLRGRDTAYRQAYGAAVLDTLKAQRRRSALCTGFAGGKRTLKERFLHMVDTRQKRGGKALCALALALVLALSTLVACTAGGAASSASGSGTSPDAQADPAGGAPASADAETARTLLTRIFTAPNQNYRDTSWACQEAMGVRPFDDAAKAEAEKAGEAFLASVAAIMDGVAAEDQLDASSRVWMAIQEVQTPFLEGENRLEPTETTLEPTANDKIFTYKLKALLTRADGETQELAFTGNIQLNEDGLVDFMKVGGDGVQVLMELHGGYKPPVWPVPAYTLLIRGYGESHQALDIAAAAGAEVLSVRNGTVTKAAEDEQLGNYVVIDDGAGRVYTYAHCDELLVKEGAFVVCGQRIATVGATGQTSGVHLHLAATQDGEPVDPMQELADVMPAEASPDDLTDGLRKQIEAHKKQAEEYQRLAEAIESEAARKHYEAYVAQEAEKMKQAQEEWAAWAAAGPTSASYDGGEFQWPLPGYTRLSTDYGTVRTIYGAKNVHRGMDIPAPAGTPVYAACDGVVSTLAHDAYGTCVKLTVNSEMALLYGHLAARYVEEGDVVTRGQKIGAVGSTGNATGEHLHFELTVNGSPASLRDYLDPAIERQLTITEE